MKCSFWSTRGTCERSEIRQTGTSRCSASFLGSVQDLGRLPGHGLVSQSFALSVLQSGLSSPLTESGFNQGDTGIFHKQIKVPAWSFCCPEITRAPQDTVLLSFWWNCFKVKAQRQSDRRLRPYDTDTLAGLGLGGAETTSSDSTRNFNMHGESENVTMSGAYFKNWKN